jgi:hypothetical protein
MQVLPLGGGVIVPYKSYTPYLLGAAGLTIMESWVYVPALMAELRRGFVDMMTEREETSADEEGTEEGREEGIVEVGEGDRAGDAQESGAHAG